MTTVLVCLHSCGMYHVLDLRLRWEEIRLIHVCLGLYSVHIAKTATADSGNMSEHNTQHSEHRGVHVLIAAYICRERERVQKNLQYIVFRMHDVYMYICCTRASRLCSVLFNVHCVC